MVSKRKTETEGSNESGMVPAVLIEEVRRLIADSRQTVATTINANLTLLYWRIGNRIIVEVLRGERAFYGQQIVVSLIRQLSWTHFIALLPLKIDRTHEVRPLLFG
jgi:excinuclease UvrABC ATPase subunit